MFSRSVVLRTLSNQRPVSPGASLLGQFPWRHPQIPCGANQEVPFGHFSYLTACSEPAAEISPLGGFGRMLSLIACATAINASVGSLLNASGVVG